MIQLFAENNSCVIITDAICIYVSYCIYVLYCTVLHHIIAYIASRRELQNWWLQCYHTYGYSHTHARKFRIPHSLSDNANCESRTGLEV